MIEVLPQTRALKILIVDDNRDARAMVKLYLGRAVCEFCECADGAEALAAYEDFRPDWVLMDWEMKRVNGLVAARHILAQFPDAAILMVTNHDDENLRRESEKAGMKGFVLKDDLISLSSFFPPNESNATL